MSLPPHSSDHAPGPAPRFSVVVVNWNGEKHLQACLDGLMVQHFRDFEVILVDNGSTDGSLTLLAPYGDFVRLLALSENTGFAAGNNAGAAIARGEWLVLLNNDAVPEPGWLAALDTAIGVHPGHDGFASCQLMGDAPSRLDGAGDAYHLWGLAKRAGYGQLLAPPWLEGREIAVPCACAAAYRRTAFVAVGGFDERFFCYFEDVDLALRLAAQSSRFRYVPEARVLHLGSASSGKRSDFAVYHGHRNLVWSFVKNTPGALLWWALPGHLLLTLVTLMLFGLRGQGLLLLRAKKDALAKLPAAWRARRELEARRAQTKQEFLKLAARGPFALWHLERHLARPS